MAASGAPEDPREGKRTLAKRAGKFARELGDQTVASHSLIEVPQPATIEPERQQATAEVDEISESEGLDLAAACELTAQLVMAIDRLGAAANPLGAPRVGAKYLPRQLGAVFGVDATAGRTGVQTDVVQDRRDGDDLPVDRPCPMTGKLSGDVAHTQAMALHRPFNSCRGGA